MAEEQDYDNFPEKTINREQGEAISLRRLCEKNNDEYIIFDYRERSSNNLLYSIPEHQRHPQWDKSDKEHLIDSIYRGYTIDGIILSQHIREGQIRYDIEDGQSRLSILQEFHNNKFKFHGRYFEDLTDSQKNIYLNYTISREILTPMPGRTEEEFQEDIYNIFERLQMGVSLSNPDKYWNRSKTPGVTFANELIEEFNDPDNNYLGTKTYGTKARSVLPEFCAMISAVLYDNYGPAFRFQYENINKILTELQKTRVRSFMNHYTNIINTAEETIMVNPNKQSYNKCSKFWGTICMDWTLNNNRQEQIIKWVYIINISRNSENFIKGSQTLYNGMNKASKQNTTNEAIESRLNRINDFYRNQNDFTTTYGIEWNAP